MVIPRKDALGREEETLPQQRLPARGIRPEKQVEGDISAHADQHNKLGSDPLSAADIGAAEDDHAHLQHNLSATTDPGVTDDDTAGYSTGSVWINIETPAIWQCVTASAGVADWNQLDVIAVTHDVLLPPTQDSHDAILDDWPHNTAGAANEVAFIWYVPAEWTGFNTVSVVMIPDAEETITADIDVSVATAGEAYNADTRQAADETLAIAAGDVDAITEWPLIDVGSLFGGIEPNDVIAIRFQSDTDTMRILGLHINYGAGG